MDSTDDASQSIEAQKRFFISYYLQPLNNVFWPLYQTTSLPLDVSSPPGKIDDRVFIGGNYAIMPILRFIKAIVARENLQPILAADFNIPRDKTNEYAHRLLLQCRRAIFEITIDNGHLMEIQSVMGTRHLAIQTLLLYMAEDDAKDPPSTMKSMIKTLDYPKQGYTSLSELDVIISTFLQTPLQ
jgi:hypothetical protein